MAAAPRVASTAAEAYGRLMPSLRVIVELPKTYVPLKREPTPEESDASPLLLQLKMAEKKKKSFKLHVGANLSIPSADANARPAYTPQAAAESAAAAARDPFAGLPFLAFAERLGAAVAPALEAAREEQRRAQLEGRAAAATAPVLAPEVPHLLPFTRWAANSETIRATFVADDPATRKKARLSWYHPDDGMVPRNWWKGGLLADFEYYNPFNLAGAGGGGAK